MAIQPSRQFKHLNEKNLDKRLDLAKIQNLESETAKNRQDVFESVQRLYGTSGGKPKSGK